MSIRLDEADLENIVWQPNGHFKVTAAERLWRRQAPSETFSPKTSEHCTTSAPPASEGGGAYGLQLALKLPLRVKTMVPGVSIPRTPSTA